MKRTRAKHEKIEGIQAVLEGYRRFDFDYIPFGTHWAMPDGGYAYRRRGIDLFLQYFWRTVTFLFGGLLLFFAFGARIKGRKNRKAVRHTGAVCVCNHFNYLDTLCVRQAVGHFRSFHTMGPRNNKTGFAGWVMRNGGMLPFSSDRMATRNLNAEIGRLLESGKIVNFYAEQALWTNYPKPRPMKDGAFHYAVKYGVPVLPVFCTFRRTKRGHARGMRIHILPAVFPDESLPRAARLADMKTRAEAEWRECYERANGKLEYLPDRRKRTEDPSRK